MGLKLKTLNQSQRDCAKSLFEILAPKRGGKAISVGTDPKSRGSNYIDGAINELIGIIEPIKINGIDDTNFYPIPVLLSDWFKQNIVTYSQKTFYDGLPRTKLLLPSYWRVRDEDNAYSSSQFRDFEYYVNRVQQLFWNDEEMGEKVRGLVLPVDDTTE